MAKKEPVVKRRGPEVEGISITVKDIDCEGGYLFFRPNGVVEINDICNVRVDDLERAIKLAREKLGSF